MSSVSTQLLRLRGSKYPIVGSFKVCIRGSIVGSFKVRVLEGVRGFRLTRRLQAHWPETVGTTPGPMPKVRCQRFLGSYMRM